MFLSAAATARGATVSGHPGTIDSIPHHVMGLLKYLSQPEEKANEDLAIGYFRKVYGDLFIRQKEARGADGYVAGSFVLELKGRSRDWLSALFQALAYRNLGLDFSQIVVAAKNFLAIWQVDQLDQSLRDDVLGAPGAPSSVGSRLAKKYAKKRSRILELATWNGAELSGSLFASNPEIVVERIRSFEQSLQNGRKVRLQITPTNFVSTLRDMKEYFDPNQPVKTVRAFYSMVYEWKETSTVELSHKADDRATLGGEQITDLIPAKRGKFKDFVENRHISLSKDENIDDFFSRYDEALDAVDRNFRIQHGIYFTDLYLSKFAMWFVSQRISDLGKNYLVIDPACGSGNLVTNWRSPLEIRHKVVSEIEPELLFAVERRMKGDQWHNGKFTVVPRVSDNAGLNFLDRSANEYLAEIARHLHEKGLKPDKPLAFLCNPPYRNDDDQGASSIAYEIHPSIRDLTGNDADDERYCCFLAQMKLICEAASESGLPGDSLLLLFTKSAWLTRRAIFERIRSEILGDFEDVAGVLVNGSEFFDIKGNWPVAFTVWRYVGKGANLNPSRSIPLADLTWMKRDTLLKIQWDNANEVKRNCNEIVNNGRSAIVEFGKDRTTIKTWSRETRLDFIRNRRKDELGRKEVGGLPLGDPRQANKKAYGELNGNFIGFMDNLTPVRVKRSTPDRPWFRLNSPFMDIKMSRCLSGPPDQKGYCANDLETAKRLFLWYAMARTFLQHPYPMWADSEDMWEPTIPPALEDHVFQTAFAIAYAENECIETTFPANNPVEGLQELIIDNPMTPLSAGSFWRTNLRPFCESSPSSIVGNLIGSVDRLFALWKRLFRDRSELPISPKPYLPGKELLYAGAGVIQIRDYARETNEPTLLESLAEIQLNLKAARTDFYQTLTSGAGVSYFQKPRKGPKSASVDFEMAIIGARRYPR